MVRKMRPSWTPSKLHAEVRFTRSALKADPNARELLSKTDAWESLCNEDHSRSIEVVNLDADMRANRRVAFGMLADEVKRFSATLLGVVMGNREHTRYRVFFPISPSDTLGQPMADVLTLVQLWLTGYQDETLEVHRAALTAYADQLAGAFMGSDELRRARLKRDDDHDAWSVQLSSERSDLFAALQKLAMDRGLDREWPSRFFQIG